MNLIVNMFIMFKFVNGVGFMGEVGFEVIMLLKCDFSGWFGVFMYGGMFV